MNYISIPNWTGQRGFQHYKDRNPLWIKVYTALLSDDDYLELTGDQRAILHGLWLEYARSSCRLPADTRLLTRRLNLRVNSRQLAALNHAGFIAIVASKSEANGYKTASPHASREETEIEKKNLSQDRSSRSEITSEPRPDLTESDNLNEQDEQPFAREPEPELPNNNGGGYDLPTIEQRPNLEPDDSMERLGDVSELVERWSGETA